MLCKMQLITTLFFLSYIRQPKFSDSPFHSECLIAFLMKRKVTNYLEKIDVFSKGRVGKKIVSGECIVLG